MGLEYRFEHGSEFTPPEPEKGWVLGTGEGRNEVQTRLIELLQQKLGCDRKEATRVWFAKGFVDKYGNHADDNGGQTVHEEDLEALYSKITGETLH